MKNPRLEKHLAWLRQRTAIRKTLREVKENPTLANPDGLLVFRNTTPNTDSNMADMLDSIEKSDKSRK